MELTETNMLRKYSNVMKASIHRLGSVMFLTLLVFLFVVIGQVNAATLSKTDISGLTLDNSRIKVLKAAPKVASLSALKLNRVLKKNERWVKTENKKIKALLTISTTDHSLTLTVYNNAGLVIGQFTPKSQFIVIPPSKDQIWIAGKESGEGYLQLDGKVRHKGIESYRPNGKIISGVTKSETGYISHIESSVNGDAIVLSSTGLFSIAVNGTINWRIPNDSSYKLIASQMGDLFGTESWDRDKDFRTLTLYGLDGEVLYSVTDSAESRIGILSISKNSRYFSVRKFVSSEPLKWHIKTLEVSADRKISVLHSMTINGGPMQVEVSDDAEIFALVVNERINTGFVRKASSLDKLGNKLFEYVSSETDKQSMKVLIENGNVQIKKLSGDIKLEIVRPAP